MVGLRQVLAQELLGGVGVVVAVEKTPDVDAHGTQAEGVLDRPAAQNNMTRKGRDLTLGARGRGVQRRVAVAKVLPEQGRAARAIQKLGVDAHLHPVVGAVAVFGVNSPAGLAHAVLVALVAKGLTVHYPAMHAGGIASARSKAQGTAAARSVVPTQSKTRRLAVALRQGGHHYPGFCRRFPSAQMNHAIEGRRTIKRRRGTLDHLDLLQCLHGQGGPLHTAGVRTQGGEVVDQHQHARPAAQGPTAARANVGLAVLHRYTRSHLKRLLNAAAGLVEGQPGRQNVHRNVGRRQISGVAADGDHRFVKGHQAVARCVATRSGLHGLSLNRKGQNRNKSR